jgi:hypothetical protein
LVVLDQTTVAIVSDNDFDIGKFDENGANIGEGVKTKIWSLAYRNRYPRQRVLVRMAS